ncbi:hypothetical protein D9615_001279 [Tricholomella constricta]|uniref:Uncharacterized protein n=1 Tax=Tricholomella constricta TaxID=117010 RepID=A0A8H5HKZ5_9AGAR|nr:hypothetical protein D9615_001279 [Tricholomella constricta]
MIICRNGNDGGVTGRGGEQGLLTSHQWLLLSDSMLNSWFGTKSHDKTKDPGGSTDLHRIFTNSTDVPDEPLKPARRTPPTGFTSPHDAVLAQMRGEPHIEDDDDGLLCEGTPALQNNEPIDGPSPTNSTTHDSNDGKELLYDPFDGTALGLLSSSSPESHLPYLELDGTGASPIQRTVGGNKEEQWMHLSRVLDLQNEVAKMHLEIEGVGSGDGKGKGAAKGRGRGKGKGLDTNIRERREWSDTVREGKAKRSATSDSIGADAHDGDDEGVDAAGDEEIEMKKARKEQFANLADQFEGRKESIQEIMNKLDHLSKALTEFHTLQAPTFEFSKSGSRQNSATPDKTPPQIQTRASPYTSTSLPNAGLTNLPNAHILRPVLPSIESTHGSLPSSTALRLASEQETHIIPASLSRVAAEPGKAKDPVASLIVNALEPGKQMHVMESPDSMKGHLKLAPDS